MKPKSSAETYETSILLYDRQQRTLIISARLRSLHRRRSRDEFARSLSPEPVGCWLQADH